MKVNKEKCSVRLREVMDEFNQTTRSMGELVNLSASTISRYLSGSMAPKTTTLEYIARQFGINPSWLLGYDVEKYIDEIDKPHSIILSNGDEILDLAAHSIGYKEKLTEDQRDDVKMAIEIALSKYRKNKQ